MFFTSINYSKEHCKKITFLHLKYFILALAIIQLADWQGGGLQTGQSHIRVQINWEEQLGSETDHTTQSSSGEIKPQSSD